MDAMEATITIGTECGIGNIHIEVFQQREDLGPNTLMEERRHVYANQHVPSGFHPHMYLCVWAGETQYTNGQLCDRKTKVGAINTCAHDRYRSPEWETARP